MTVKLNHCAFENAKRLIEEGKFVADERDAWSEHHPSTRMEKEFIEQNGFAEYGKWFLAVNDDHPEDRRGHYEFPYGDLVNVHRCAILSAQRRARYYEIKKVTTALLDLIDDQER